MLRSTVRLIDVPCFYRPFVKSLLKFFSPPPPPQNPYNSHHQQPLPLTMPHSPSSLTERTPVLSEEALCIAEAFQPGSSTAVEGKYHLPFALWTDPQHRDEASMRAVAIPEYLESKATLEYMGLCEEAAERIWRWYEDAMATGEVGPYTFLDVIIRNTIRRYEENAIYEHDDWEGVARRMGLRDSFAQRIMDPDWKDWRLSGSVKEWARLMFEDRWSHLQGLDWTIRHFDWGERRKGDGEESEEDDEEETDGEEEDDGEEEPDGEGEPDGEEESAVVKKN